MRNGLWLLAVLPALPAISRGEPLAPTENWRDPPITLRLERATPAETFRQLAEVSGYRLKFDPASPAGAGKAETRPIVWSEVPLSAALRDCCERWGLVSSRIGRTGYRLTPKSADGGVKELTTESEGIRVSVSEISVRASRQGGAPEQVSRVLQLAVRNLRGSPASVTGFVDLRCAYDAGEPVNVRSRLALLPGRFPDEQVASFTLPPAPQGSRTLRFFEGRVQLQRRLTRRVVILPLLNTSSLARGAGPGVELLASGWTPSVPAGVGDPFCPVYDDGPGSGATCGLVATGPQLRSSAGQSWLHPFAEDAAGRRYPGEPADRWGGGGGTVGTYSARVGFPSLTGVPRRLVWEVFDPADPVAAAPFRLEGIDLPELSPTVARTAGPPRTTLPPFPTIAGLPTLPVTFSDLPNGNPRISLRLIDVGAAEATRLFAEATRTFLSYSATPAAPGDGIPSTASFEWRNAPYGRALRELCARFQLRLTGAAGRYHLARAADAPLDRPAARTTLAEGWLELLRPQVERFRRAFPGGVEETGALQFRLTGSLPVDANLIAEIVELRAVDDRGVNLSGSLERSSIRGVRSSYGVFPGEFSDWIRLTAPHAEAHRLRRLEGVLVLSRAAQTANVLLSDLPAVGRTSDLAVGGGRIRMHTLFRNDGDGPDGEIVLKGFRSEKKSLLMNFQFRGPRGLTLADPQGETGKMQWSFPAGVRAVGSGMGTAHVQLGAWEGWDARGLVEADGALPVALEVDLLRRLGPERRIPFRFENVDLRVTPPRDPGQGS